MDFFIEDAVEDLEDSKINVVDDVLKNYITFVDIDTFKAQYLASAEYYDPSLVKFGLITLQHNNLIEEFNCEEDSELKLR